MSASPDLQFALQLLWTNDYSALIIVTVVAYDYLLTFSSEIDYVWLRPWTWISTMFLLVRYVGISTAILYALGGTTFIPGPVIVCTAVSMINVWLIPVFLAAADLVMIVRVYAIWNRSKRILVALLLLFVAQVILSFVYAGFHSNTSSYLSVTVGQILDFSFCNYSVLSNPGMLDVYSSTGSRLALGAILLVLAVTPILKQSIEMYKATKRWQPNRYLQLLVKDGIIYFVANTLFDVMSIINVDTLPLLFVASLSTVFLFPLMPRFIISVRELYDSELRVHGIDTGFGALSHPISSRNAVVSSIAFADVTPGQVVEGEAVESEAIQPEV
ncbi:hypothetical protein L210DRAFT_2194096 [Boletus edulis BED1]|uniref:DUF6533 domain-containing protein n=1 Tax=Boletus edulis BED1 TaxID=1328754 RepID=A0AAD4BU34_BOLED|nr:hypothetical protein L210DRAFT_2194096 [Boletus edulis BED1]